MVHQPVLIVMLMTINGIGTPAEIVCSSDVNDDKTVIEAAQASALRIMID